MEERLYPLTLPPPFLKYALGVNRWYHGKYFLHVTGHIPNIFWCFKNIRYYVKIYDIKSKIKMPNLPNKDCQMGVLQRLRVQSLHLNIQQLITEY